MNKLRLLLILFLTVGVFATTEAYRPFVPEPAAGDNNTNSQSSFRTDCTESTSQTDLNVNNVRARLLGGGDMWWDFNDARYVVPNVPLGSGLPEVSSIFAGAIWLGGWEFDEFGQPANLKMAAQTYRSSTRNDFWAGPLDVNGGTEEAVCNQWDKHFEVAGDDIVEHIAEFQSGALDCAEIPTSIRGWPGKGNPYFALIHGFELPFQNLAPFFDANGDDVYNPCDGDFPVIEIIGCEDVTGEVSKVSFADQMIWYVFNDNGGIHTRTTGDPIRMEVQTLAFSYKTGDEVNDMTFYRYKLINKSAITIDSTYFGQWVDADLGCYTDDFIGADTSRALMYIYNDGTPDGADGCDVPTYGNEVPMLGVDYFRGPKDEFGVELGMSSFIYYVNGGWPGLPDTGDPTQGEQFYNYLAGRWRDGTPYYAGGNGYQQTAFDETQYVLIDPPNQAGGWSMCEENLPGADLRTVQASGPFTLIPGAVNELIIGVVWTPDVAYPCPSLDQLTTADNLAQALYDNCFKITDGPDAPSMDIVELDKKLVILLSNDTLAYPTNNPRLTYQEKDLQAPPGIEDSMYVFEGYKVFQLAEPNFNDLDDPNQARLIFQSDLNNDVDKIYNWEEFPGQPANVPVFTPELKVDGLNRGISSSLVVTEDQFAEGDRTLVNHKTYYFVAVAYAYNNYEEYNPTSRSGQRRSYLEGRRNVEITAGIPRINSPEYGGLVLNADYGDGAIITRIDGEGTGLNFLDISDETLTEILNGDNPTDITYKQGAGPIGVKVVDPLRVKPGTYTLRILDDTPDDNTLSTGDDAYWIVEGNGETWVSELPLNVINEQILMGRDVNNEENSLGISLTIGQVEEPGVELESGERNGLIGATVTYVDQDAIEWYDAIAPNGQFPPINYVPTADAEPYQARDPQEIWKNVLDGRWVPYTMTQCVDQNAGPLGYLSPAWATSAFCNIIQSSNGLDKLRNVDIVLTSDKSLWSRSVVVETARTDLTSGGFTTEGGVEMMKPRAHASLDKDGNDETGSTGFSWFPGYAVDVETGRRLNIFFGENSVYRPDEPTMSNFVGQLSLNGGDMVWNPSSENFVDLDGTGNPSGAFELVMGGHHFVYVSNTDYDECADIHTKLSGAPGLSIQVFRDVVWTSFPVLPFGEEMLSMADGLVPADVSFKLRVQNPYSVSAEATENNGYPMYEFTLDGIAPTSNDAEVAQTALDLVNVVPNPYYAYSAYELQNTTNTVKITNLPARSVVTIYSLDGKFIRQYDRAEEEFATIPKQGSVAEQISASVDWDLKNAKGIPISSGVYLIHINAPGVGERTIKWFGIQRKFDTLRN